jgi:hypothetical protein
LYADNRHSIHDQVIANGDDEPAPVVAREYLQD